jgi:PEP-CTERM motif
MKNLSNCKLFQAGAIAGAAIWLTGSAWASDIATIQSQPGGTTGLTVDSGPVVTAIMSQPGTFNGHVYGSWAVLAQDTTGSLDVYSSAASFGSYLPNVGDVITASGTYSPYHQIPELASLTSISATSTGHPVPASPIATVAGLNSSLTIPQNLAGYPVEIDNVTMYTDSAATIPATGSFPNANTGFYLKDSAGNIMELYFWVTSYSCDGQMVGGAIPSGPFNVVGLLSQSGSFGVEITPYSFTAVPEPSALALLGFGLLTCTVLRRRALSR